MTKKAPTRYYFLSYFLENPSQTGYLSDIHHQWLVWKKITEPSRLSNNINMFGKANVEKMAVEKSILLADLTYDKLTAQPQLVLHRTALRAASCLVALYWMNERGQKCINVGHILQKILPCLCVTCRETKTTEFTITSAACPEKTGQNVVILKLHSSPSSLQIFMIFSSKWRCCYCQPYTRNPSLHVCLYVF